MIYYCHDCGEFFDKEDIRIKCISQGDYSEPSEYEWYCPHCGSEDIEEAEECEFCGEPVKPDSRIHFCEDCIEYFDYMIEQMVEVIANEWGCPPAKAKEALLEFIAEKY